ncbi:hypothetical protein [Floridanema aerugineum]|uniref:Uncharacterized protein n=1 Tax=Floridaenema aerugineum BLCC-F46 TaxID=3153654 RepID=A0ABV4X3D7_9CYAN
MGLFVTLLRISFALRYSTVSALTVVLSRSS